MDEGEAEMEFGPHNPIVKLCFQGMAMQDKGMAVEAREVLLCAWNEATQGFEKFIAAWFLAKGEADAAGRLKWLEAALRVALEINDNSVRSALPALYSGIARCHEALNSPGEAQKHRALAAAVDVTPADEGPFYHGTKADLRVGDLLVAGGLSNYQADLKMNHIYFTANRSGAGLAAEMAKGEAKGRVYIVEPTGRFENDPNVTNNKFPGNLTRSYRSEASLRIVGEVGDWVGQTPEELEKWRGRVGGNKGEIIN